jgi:hypothetical protein
MRHDFIARYFSAEKLESALFLAVGLVAVAAAVWLWRSRHRWRGAIVPLVAIGAIQMIVGGTVFLRTDAQVEKLRGLRETAPAAFRADETHRMRQVIRNFETYEKIEIALIALGIGMAVALRRRATWRAFGLALALQSGLMLALDFAARARAHDYLKAVLAT